MTLAPADSQTPRLSNAATWAIRLVLGILLIAALLGVQYFIAERINDYVARIILLVGMNIIMAVSLNLINGITGQFSLGHAGFMAIGAYVSGVVSFYIGPRLGLPDPLLLTLAIAAGALAAAFAGWLVGLPSLRLRGDYLAIVTLGFAEIIRVVITTIEEVGAARGFNGLPVLVNFAWIYGAVFLCILVVRNLASSKIGREMRAVRDDEVAAEAIGINTTRVKVVAFVFSSLLAGVAGALQAHFNGSAHPDSFGFLRSVEIVVMVVLGGLGSISGAAIAAIILTLLENVLRSVNGVFMVAILLILFAVIVTFPKHKPAMQKNLLSAWRWLLGPVLFGIVLAAGYFQGYSWLSSNISSMRYVIYASILIILMLLRPQGLLGRSELALPRLRRFRNETAAEPVL